MTFPYKIVKLDKRHTGHQTFAYSITCSINNLSKDNRQRFSIKHIVNFLSYHKWFWETFGASAEFNNWQYIQSEGELVVSTSWAWAAESNKIYIADDLVLSHFLLTHSG